MISKLAVAGALMLAHSWYDPWCCDEKDCRAIASDQVVAKPDGYHVMGFVVAYKDARVSADADYHVCILFEQMRCFYAPPGGV